MARHSGFNTITSAHSGADPWVPYTISGTTGWTPAATDRIIIQPYNLDESNNLGKDASIPNMKMWASWDAGASNWKIYPGFQAWVGTFFYVIKTS